MEEKPVSIVIVEDDPFMRRQLSSALEREAGLRLVACFGSGNEALDWFSVNTADIALVDIGLPDLSGIEVVSHISQGHPCCECLVISTFGDEETVLAAICAGAAGYLLKDPDPVDLAAAVQTIRQGGSPMNPLIARMVTRRLRTAPPALPDANRAKGILGEREHEVLNLIARGYTYAEVAGLMHISLSTVQSHIKSIYQKLSVRSRSEAVYEARAMGLLSDTP